ncbi:MAG TPA: Ig-like domain repeat protein [Actinophytocola sp.]|uniref:Ig-like domain repeat protein n=1 Tax=Actinophytocola sp. TaxID=1872138 RepID=UPI002DB7D37F|nr:Ig-like domain repeat protein [Actinophytocola sp.]HEU5475638.1 Ig-like domain repeat protein [Actinophytocola sp.]
MRSPSLPPSPAPTTSVQPEQSPLTSSPDIGTCTTDPLTPGPTPNDATGSCTLTTTPGQAVTVTATYTGDTTYDPATATTTYQAAQATPTVTITGPTSPGPSGETTFTATVTGSGSIRPTGTVTLTSIPAYQAERLTPTVIIVRPALPVPTGPPQEVRFAATVIGSGGIRPTGTITFTGSPGDASCTSGPITAGPGSSEATGSCVLRIRPGERLTVTARYSGDMAYTPASSVSVIYETARRTPTVAVTGPTSPGPSGAVTFTATVTGSDGIPPTGTVTFTSSPDVGSCSTDPLTPGPGTSAATGSCALTIAPGQSVTVTAIYLGDVVYTPAASAPATYQTVRLTPAVAVTGPASGPPGPVTFTVAVTGSGGIRPTGTVTLTTVPGDSACTTDPLIPGLGTSDATGSCAVTIAPGQLVTIVATYNGDSVYSPASSTPTYQAGQLTPTVTVAGPAASGPSGLVPFTATVTGSGGVRPTGTVILTGSSDTVSCTIDLDTPGPGTSDATGTCALQIGPGQAVTVTAGYSGDAGYLSATGETTYQADSARRATLAMGHQQP